MKVEVTHFSKNLLLADVTFYKKWSSYGVMTSNSKESELIENLKRGDVKSYSVLIDTYKNLVFSLALKMLKNREEAEEVAQDSFIKAIKSIKTFRGQSKLSTWLYRIVYHNCLDRLKLKKKDYQNFTIEENFNISDADAMNALDLLENDDKKKSVENCINKLSSDDSFILTLYYFEDNTLEEIGNVMGIKPNNAKIKLFRARKRLTAIFKQHLEPELIEHYDRTR